VRVSRYWFAPAPGEAKWQAAPGESKRRAAPGEREPAASQCAERSDGDSDSSNRGTGIRGVSESGGNFTPSRARRPRCARSGRRRRWDRAVRPAFLSILRRMRSGGRGQRGRAWLGLRHRRGGRIRRACGSGRRQCGRSRRRPGARGRGGSARWSRRGRPRRRGWAR
jgi:hypothetical protein